jgi:hypothetical protein
MLGNYGVATQVAPQEGLGYMELVNHIDSAPFNAYLTSIIRVSMKILGKIVKDFLQSNDIRVFCLFKSAKVADLLPVLFSHQLHDNMVHKT